ncbi:RDD family protein [Spiroplasma endosymbiont of Atherix ibis]|uniref:RDD family protein n=1 Tax=Spiroplasma endosymbiont of Atherix ibis TaxID=3066291 RepID=UPI0030D11DC6
MEKQNNKSHLKKSSHKLVKPHLGRIFLSRLFDIIICSVPTIVLSFLNPIHDWKTFLINISISQVILFVYFILVPYFLKGNTLGKLIFNLRLKKEDQSKIKLKDILFREFYFLYIPLLFQIIVQIIMGIIIFTNSKETDLSFVLRIINSIGYTFLAIWFIYIPLTIYLQEENISSVDLKLNIRVYYLEKILIFEKKEIYKKHIHLENDRPGKVDVSEIDKIIGEENE